VNARLLSVVSGALVAGSSLLLACANGEPVAGDDLAWEGREDAGTGGGTGGGGSTVADAGLTPSTDSGAGRADAGTPSFDAGGGGGGGTCSPQ
jgi:hypothetical protein